MLEQLKTLYKAGGVAVDKIPPTVGLNLGNINCGGFAVTLWDLGGAAASQHHLSYALARNTDCCRCFGADFVHHL